MWEVKKVKLIAGLGNPGIEYQHTRHNIGFIAIDYLAERLGAEFNKSKFFALTAQASYHGEKLLLLKPQTFMNLSGKAVRAAADFYKIDPSEILIIFDDMDLPCGQLRIRQKGSAGGHNGMKDIISQMGNNQNISRFRLGISHPLYGDPAAYVLGRFSDEEKLLLRPAVEDAADAALCWIEMGTAAAMNRFNGKAARPLEK